MARQRQGGRGDGKATQGLATVWQGDGRARRVLQGGGMAPARQRLGKARQGVGLASARLGWRARLCKAWHRQGDGWARRAGLVEAAAWRRQGLEEARLGGRGRAPARFGTATARFGSAG